VAEGCANKQIAAALRSAIATVKVHRGRVMRKLGAASVADLVRFSQRLCGVNGSTGARTTNGG
jgi:FixJ family two-component response regulator